LGQGSASSADRWSDTDLLEACDLARRPPPLPAHSESGVALTLATAVQSGAAGSGIEK